MHPRFINRVLLVGLTLAIYVFALSLSSQVTLWHSFLRAAFVAIPVIFILLYLWPSIYYRFKNLNHNRNEQSSSVEEPGQAGGQIIDFTVGGDDSGELQPFVPPAVEPGNSRIINQNPAAAADVIRQLSVEE